MVKIYRQHNCSRNHRSTYTLSKCMFPRAAWVTGSGQFATLAWCRVLTVMLHESLSEAMAAKRFIDEYFCGGDCYNKHDLVRIDLEGAYQRPERVRSRRHTTC